ncbi:MAG: type II toxin-antitoxin system Phd/YefM family antitoxin [Acidimicrobiales bacterium]
MNTIINVFEAKTHLSQLLERARAGEEIILAKNGKPYARLVGLETPPKRQLGFMKGTVDAAFFDPLTEEEVHAWE